jgi:hypothetical protein
MVSKDLLSWAEEEENISVVESETHDNKFTQMDILKGMLIENIYGVCSTDILKEYIPRGSALIWTLRHEENWIIDTETCDLHEHKNHQIKYVYRGKKY